MCPWTLRNEINASPDRWKLENAGTARQLGEIAAIAAAVGAFVAAHKVAGVPPD
jgi:hypothetical protein